jgi:hypothetical protein
MIIIDGSFHYYSCTLFAVSFLTELVRVASLWDEFLTTLTTRG